MSDQRNDTGNTYDLLKAEFKTLRDEIHITINKQNNILIGGYGFIAGIVGLVLSDVAALRFLLVAVPLAALFMTSLWMVECNRMVRAGLFIAKHLWPELQKAAGVDAELGMKVNWEAWIRQTQGLPDEFGRRQHYFQMIAVMLIPSLASLIAMGIALWSVVHPAWLTGILFVFLVIWLFFGASIGRISYLAATAHEPDEGGFGNRRYLVDLRSFFPARKGLK